MPPIAEQPWNSRYAWRLWLRPPAPGDPRLGAESMTAAEQMFFLGAPLAHVVEYEKSLRTRRNREPGRSAGRLSRIVIRRALATAE